MKVKRKGTVNPFLSSPFSSSCKDPDSVLKLLPVTILTLAFSLPNQDREVLAYLISRSSIPHSSSSFSATSQHGPKNKCRTSNKSNAKKVPLFECGCFDCYTSFWYRWDSSPNRELIHQVIEAFEEHLLINETPRKHSRGGKRKGNSRRAVESDVSAIKESEKKGPEVVPVVAEDDCEVEMEMDENGGICKEEKQEENTGIDEVTENLEMEVVTVQAMGLGANYHKGFARKVLPDVVGLFNSRLWSLWSPGI